MLAAGGLLILLAMGYAVSGMVSDGTPGESADDDTAPDAPEAEADEMPLTEGSALADLLFGSDEDMDDTGGGGIGGEDRGDSDQSAGWLDGDDDMDEPYAGDDAEDGAQDGVTWDRLTGSDGDDALRLGPGIEATGGAGADVFSVAPVLSGDAGDAAGDAEGDDIPRITDFEPGVDRLILEFDGPDSTAPEITFDTETMPDGTLVMANGVAAAMLIGVTAMDPMDVEVQMIPGQTLDGTEGNDTLTGGAGDDTIDGYAGDDLLDGGTGDDVLRGREGMDSLLGGSGNDAITGGPGDDTIRGGPDNDVLFGNEGDDLITGGSGADEIYGDEGDDTIDGGDGTDFLVGGDGHDVISGGAGSDLLFGNDGDDSLSGGEGDDFLQGGFGKDTLDGGAGNDRLDGTFTSGGPHFGPYDEDQGDVLNGGDGDDTILIGAEDVATGGAGADTFITGSYIETAEVAGHVTDFQPGLDVIEVMFDPDLTPDPVITVEDFADGTGANILFEGQLILKVSGAQGMDPALIELRAIQLEAMAHTA